MLTILSKTGFVESFTNCPITKKDATTSCFSSLSKMIFVISVFGPSSNVKAINFFSPVDEVFSALVDLQDNVKNNDAIIVIIKTFFIFSPNFYFMQCKEFLSNFFSSIILRLDF